MSEIDHYCQRSLFCCSKCLTLMIEWHFQEGFPWIPEGENKALFWSVSPANSSAENNLSSNYINKQLASTSNAHLFFVLAI